MLEYKKIHILEGIDLNKSDKSKECDLCHYWHFLEKTLLMSLILALVVVM